ncbi:hypothetical protein ACH4NF_20765 [Streptomyces sp. NPDC017248]|uniref:hypothetical protein n=1 Tax=unclassified Streptomyces TaxID=2593676 RepID=UPI0037B77627
MRIRNDGWAVVVGDVDRAWRLEGPLAAAGLPWTAIEEPDDLTGLARPAGAELTVLALPPTHEGAGPATRLLRETARIVAGRPRTARPRLWCVTLGGSERPGGADSVTARLWDLGRSVGQELPGSWAGVLDLAPDPALDAPERVAQFLAADRPAGGVLAPRRDGAADPVTVR